ncbi:NAD-dependent epimerase/dehydratase family protein [Microcystis aeruginosa BLCCF158]|jgi:nucleoside-diphosphate-sugar epimerase|uniref:NAD-dependent epimerase/dehydratase family protein n=1 Tax=Microcystis aeruginosa BLCC-F158 TaxID=2755316 RepID=A0A841UZ75_MICAE|nr:NAD-dependent epimerase/dehydratase family protein [Microcystis aeruginosa]MBC1196443.1 NAD-dependent epimerase/dehydratase family protein [Microcystis aeruginosa BLCC-F158]
MKVLVTGATGLVGSHLTEFLVKKGYDVRCLIQPSSDQSLLENWGVEIRQGDIREAEILEKAVKGCQKVYHLAAKVAHPGISYQTYYEVNVGGTINVTQACLKNDVERLIYGSTTGVYGTISNPPVNEKTPANPDSPYRQTKWIAEQSIIDAYRQEGLPVVTVRLTSVTGARASHWSGLLRAISKGNFRGVGTGENHHHTVDVNDVVQGLLCCANTPNIEGECYLIAHDHPIQFKALCNLMAEELGVNPIEMTNSIVPFKLFGDTAHFLYRSFGIKIPHGNRYDLFLSNKILDISKAKKELGYSPKVSIKESIHYLVNWYQKQEQT